MIPLYEYICNWMDTVSPECSIVEMGSGSAPILQKLKRTHQYTGLEISDKYIEMCNKKWFGLLHNRHVTFIQVDLATYFGSASPLQGDVLYSGNVLYYFNQDIVAKYINNAMQTIQAKYFVIMEVSKFFPLPECSFLKLIQTKEFTLDFPLLKEFKRNRTIEIYERI